MKISIIIVTCNNFLSLSKQCLDTIERFTDLSNKEIIIISNGSTDETVSYIEQRKQAGFPYKLLEFPRAISFSKAINIGALVAEGEYLLFFRDDAYIMDKTKKDLWVDWLLSPFYKNLSVGITGLFKARDRDTREDFILFVCCMVKRSVFEFLGELDEDSNSTRKEVDFCIKLKRNGYKIMQVPEDFPIDERTNTAAAYSPVGYGRTNKIEFFDDYIIKTYSETDKVIKTSSLDNELYCINKFSLGGKNIYCPEVQRINKNKYKIKRYKLSLGSPWGVNQENVRRMLFTISFEEFIRQTQEIEKILKITEIKHKDVHPANLLFSEEDRHLKVIDFYFSTTDGLVVGESPTSWSHDDSISFQQVRRLVTEVFETIKKPLEFMNSILSDMGKVPRDGSAPLPGMPYHKIDIPYFSGLRVCKDTTKEFTDIFTNISCKPKKVLDVGCALGYNSFNLMRKFFLEKLIAFEADPYVFTFLQECKRIFNLNELELNRSIDYTTLIPRVDIVLCTNVHQWIYKQLGKEKTEMFMRNLISNCKELFFQTSGAESGGQQVKDLRSKEDIQNYLHSVGAKEVTFISSSSAHGGLRHLFKVRGEL